MDHKQNLGFPLRACWHDNYSCMTPCFHRKGQKDRPPGPLAVCGARLSHRRGFAPGEAPGPPQTSSAGAGAGGAGRGPAASGAGGGPSPRPAGGAAAGARSRGALTFFFQVEFLQHAGFRGSRGRRQRRLRRRRTGISMRPAAGARGARAGRGRARRARARGGPGELRGGQSARPGSARRRREEGPPGAAGGDPPAARPPPAPALGRRWPGRRPACRPSPRSAVAPEVWVWPGGRNVGGGPGEQRAGSRGERGAPLRPRPCSPSRRPSGH